MTCAPIPVPCVVGALPLYYLGKLAGEARADAWHAAARAVMTTDTFPKLATRTAKIGGFSAHADYGEVLKWLEGMNDGVPSRTFLTHGAPDAANAARPRRRSAASSPTIHALPMHAAASWCE